MKISLWGRSSQYISDWEIPGTELPDVIFFGESNPKYAVYVRRADSNEYHQAIVHVLEPNKEAERIIGSCV